MKCWRFQDDTVKFGSKCGTTSSNTLVALQVGSAAVATTEFCPNGLTAITWREAILPRMTSSFARTESLSKFCHELRRQESLILLRHPERSKSRRSTS